MMTAGKDYGVEVIVAYANRLVGQVFYPPGLLRDALVRSGRVKRLAPPVEEAEAEDAEQPDEKSGRGRRKQVRTTAPS